MKKEYQTLREAIMMIEDWSNGQRKVIEFRQCNRFWEFTLDNDIKIKLLAI